MRHGFSYLFLLRCNNSCPVTGMHITRHVPSSGNVSKEKRSTTGQVEFCHMLQSSAPDAPVETACRCYLKCDVMCCECFCNLCTPDHPSSQCLSSISIYLTHKHQTTLHSKQDVLLRTQSWPHRATEAKPCGHTVMYVTKSSSSCW